MNAAEREKFGIAIERLRIVVAKDSNALIPADGVLEWLRELV